MYLRPYRLMRQEEGSLIASARQAHVRLEEKERELEAYRQENSAAEEQVKNLKAQVANLRVKLVDLGYLEKELVSATVESEMAKRQKVFAYTQVNFYFDRLFNSRFTHKDNMLLRLD